MKNIYLQACKKAAIKGGRAIADYNPEKRMLGFIAGNKKLSEEIMALLMESSK